MNRFWRVIDGLNRGLLTASSVMLILLMLIGAADVIGRYVLGIPIKGALGISEVLLVGVVFLAWPYTQAEDENVKVVMFYERFSPKLKSGIGIVRSLMALCVFTIMAWQSVNKALESRESGEIIDVLNIPAYPFHFFLTVGVSVLCLQLLVDFMKFCRTAKGE